MRIDAVETLRTPLQPNLCLLRLHAADGGTGLGESFWGAAAVEAYLHESVAPRLLSTNDPTPEGIATLLRPYVGYAASGAETRGNGAVDIALWDLLGKRSGLSIAQLMGGPVRPRLRIYNTCAGYDYIKTTRHQSSVNWGLPGASMRRAYDDLDAFLNRPAELVESLMAQGITAMKVWPFDTAAENTGGLHVSAADIRQGMWILEQMRSAGGDQVEIMIEMHSLWSLKAATTILHAVADIAPYWVEDPIRADGVVAYRQLKDRTSVPIAVGEALAGRRAFRPLLESGALDVAIVDVGWTGGITEARKIAALADSFDTPFAPHDCTGPVSFAVCTQLVASQPNGLIVESVRAFHDSWYPQLVDGLPVPEGGLVDISDKPGLGITLRRDFVESAATLRRTTTTDDI